MKTIEEINKIKVEKINKLTNLDWPRKKRGLKLLKLGMKEETSPLTLKK